MSTLKYYLLDVFTEERFSGNQLAVFLGGKDLSSREMQRIAKEMNISEITFILSDAQDDGSYKVRIFTPEHEVDFAGHPTIGTAHIINTVLENEDLQSIILDLKVGKIPVTCSTNQKGNPIYWMKQVEPVFGEKIGEEQLIPVLGLSNDDFDVRFPIQEVSTGLAHILVPLKNLSSLKKAVINKDRYFELINMTWAKNIMIFCPEPHGTQNDISVRMFADYLGIPEDPATGSGNGCLAGYMAKYRYFGSNRIDKKSEQGYEIGRPSLLHLKAEETAGKIDVQVGGNAVIVARGEFI